ncbi:hypothetical protein P7K49_005784 [Saguinus oedipus]|uniref:Uncharacterized protein n=1 Tax=Saguinus oedipus TaxID=9490 RepID=A0ABQ9W0I3_SAGOE|nr:hypothetical protein P7K49_005784 [Saguinus oedipus]
MATLRTSGGAHPHATGLYCTRPARAISQQSLPSPQSALWATLLPPREREPGLPPPGPYWRDGPALSLGLALQRPKAPAALGPSQLPGPWAPDRIPPTTRPTSAGCR